MPMYRVRCQTCLREDDIYRSFADYQATPECHGKPMQRVICPVMVATDIQPYRSTVTGEIINSRSEHRAHLREHRLVEIGNETKYLQPKASTPPPGLKEEIIRVANEKLRS